ncbi:uncharacterized protein LOC114312262 [Camellia sinensis]|uniref:Uncharacterized protein n=1 Tax=Camellia sinensis TaxID=4442 RepID=A0A7J7G909_CAMSI|nr:uncharacterized protein LOC114312262 [Camellia sinensis]KAF5937219.1 hypothetical protein HYC85_024725 [Camellia sinensis]
MFRVVHQNFLCIEAHPLSDNHTFSLIRKCRIRIPTSRFDDDDDGGEKLIKKRGRRRRRINLNFHVCRAVEKESEFEVDPDKARESLRKLDEQLQSLSNKPINRPKIRASELDDARVQMKEERPKFSESSLAYLAFALLIFTIFYNVLFITVIKPSIDGPEPIEEPVAATSVRKAS